MGYYRAACRLGIKIEITGLDIKEQPNYPFRFVRCDVTTIPLHYFKNFSHIHASPPCQAYSRTRHLHKNIHPDLLQPVRDQLKKTGLPYVIENVPGAIMENEIRLDGTMFGLRVIRKRLFECSRFLLYPTKGYKAGPMTDFKNPDRHPNKYFCVAGHLTGTKKEWGAAMGIDWMNRKELAQAIPPAYTEFIGMQFFDNNYEQ